MLWNKLLGLRTSIAPPIFAKYCWNRFHYILFDKAMSGHKAVNYSLVLATSSGSQSDYYVISTPFHGRWKIYHKSMSNTTP